MTGSASEIAIRAAGAADVEQIAAIHVAGWKAAYRGILPAEFLDALTVESRIPRWREWVEGPGVHTLIAERDGEAVGFTRLSPPRRIAPAPKGAAEVTHLYVAAAERGKGTGRALLSRAAEIARSDGYAVLLLWVLEENRPARRFYERFGLAPDGSRRTDLAYFGNDAGEVRYRMPLRPAG